MFNVICPEVFKQLPTRTDLTQGKLGEAMGGTRHSVANFESGKTFPDAAQEERLLQVARCSKEEFVEMVCAVLSELIGKPVGIKESHGGYEPTTALARARALSAGQARKIPGSMLRLLKSRIKESRMLSVLLEHHTDELLDLIREVGDALKKRRRRKVTSMT